jgi:class 3 adenylate cyclase
MTVTEMNDSLANEASLTISDIQVIDQFRRQKNTAVLTILFTDIKGFTQMTEQYGEAYSNQMRHHHDEIVVPVIERDGGGRVIKHIGDAVMAVFSEPSTAVERSLEIQEKLAQFNRAHPDLQDLHVRMGLHSGQVTTEDNVSTDVFGRHVNRAARVEALADGGQVLVTYPVFDSARGWMHEKSDRPVSWEKHGLYALKGIDEPIEIYEAYNAALTRPSAPAGGIKGSGFPVLRTAAAVTALLCLIGAGAYGFLQLKRPQVSFVDYNPYYTKFFDDQPIIVGGEDGQHIREVLTPLRKGHYLLRGDSGAIVRSFAPFDVHSGKNLITLRGERVELPSVSRHISSSETEPNEAKLSEDETYATFDAQMNRHENKVHIDYGVKVEKDPQDANRFKFTCEWTIVLNGKEISKDSLVTYNDAGNTDTVRPPSHKILWGDDFHFYYVTYYMIGRSAEFTIEANFNSYKDL